MELQFNPTNEASTILGETGNYEKLAGAIEIQLLAACEAANGDRVKILRAMRLASLECIRLSIIYAEGPDIELDHIMAAMLDENISNNVLPYTSSLDAARSFVSKALPGFWVSSGICGLTGHCSLGPDYNGPEGARLSIEWPIGECPEQWADDLAPGDGSHRECYAILSCTVQAMIYQQERGL